MSCENTRREEGESRCLKLAGPGERLRYRELSLRSSTFTSAQLLALLDGQRTSAELAAELQMGVAEIDEVLGHFADLALLEE